MINDIPTLQSMVKKRDEIIAKMKEDLERQPVEIDALETMTDNAKAAAIDYEELCIQLKAANGEIARLEEQLDTLRKTHDTCLEDKNTLYDEVKDLQKELKDATDDKNELEDKLDILPIPPYNKEMEEQYQSKIKLLEEKLALCDKYYNKAQKKLFKINDLSSMP